MNQRSQMPFFLIAFLTAAMPNAFGAAATATYGAGVGTVPTKAAAINCTEIKDRVLKDLISLRTTPEEVAQKCNWNSTSKANNDEEESVGDKKMSGACQLTYGTINHYADAAEKKLTEVCQVVEEAKAITCEGQKACSRELAAKDREAAKKLKETSAMLKKAQKTLATRQKANLEVAEKYKKVFASIDIALAQTPKGTDLQSTLSKIKTDDIFGPKSPDAWTALNNNQLPPTAGFYVTYDQSFPKAFDENDDAAQAPQPAPTRALGTYTQELSDASGAAGRAIQYVNVAEPKVSSASDRFEQRAIQVGGNATNLGSIDAGSAANVVSSLSGTTNAASKLAGATGASRAITAGSGLAGALASGDSSGSLAAVPAGGSGNSRTISSADLSQNDSSNAAASPGSNSGDGSTAGDPASAKKDNSELLSAFAPLGTAAVGEDPDLKQVPNAAGTAAATPAAAKAAGGNAAASAQRRLQFSGTYQGATNTGANGDVVAPSQAGGLRASIGARSPASLSEDTPASSSSEDKTARLREMLRRRLAERTSSGGDADASSAVDDLLYAGGNQNGAPENSASERTDARNEQAGPQAMESEPLFQRVHHAHRRFLQRSFPRQAGI